MTTYIGVLRAINVGGHQPVAMADLRALVGCSGFSDVQSVLQSGNLVFRGRRCTTASVEHRLEMEAFTRLALDTAFFVRTSKELRTVVAHNPFVAEADRDPSHLVVMFLKSVPDAKAVKALQEAVTGRELVRAKGAHAYIVFPDGIGRSRLTHALIERKLGTRGTGRNWKTVLKLDALADA